MWREITSGADDPAAQGIGDRAERISDEDGMVDWPQ